jgi:hypothetical protein
MDFCYIRAMLAPFDSSSIDPAVLHRMEQE